MTNIFEGLNLNDKQKAFVKAYCRIGMHHNATRAYAEAYGFDLNDDGQYNSASTNASNLLKNTNIIRAIEKERERIASQHEELAKSILVGWINKAEADITKLFREDTPMVLKDMKDIPEELRACIKTMKFKDGAWEITLHDSLKASENIAKAIGMFVEINKNTDSDYVSLLEKVRADVIED